MILIIDQNLKEADFYLYEEKDGNPALFKKETMDMDSAGDWKDKGIRAAFVRLRFGGDLFDTPSVVDNAFLDAYAGLTPYFPFYVPLTHAFLKKLLHGLEGIPLYAMFETSLFRTLPEEERVYAIPREYNEKIPVRRFGYHGLFHAFQASRMNTPGTLLSIVLDKQTTVCAIEGGRPSYISVGYTPLEGIMGRTTCGDLDPGVAFYLLRELKGSFYSIDHLLKKESGFKGLTGLDLEMGDLYRHAGDKAAVQRAFEIFFNQILRHAGAALAVSGPLSGLVFGGRFIKDLLPLAHRIARKLAFQGITLKGLPWDLGDQPLAEVSEVGSRLPVRINTLTLPEVMARLAWGMKGGSLCRMP